MYSEALVNSIIQKIHNYIYANEGLNNLTTFLPLASKGKEFQIAAARSLCGLFNF